MYIFISVVILLLAAYTVYKKVIVKKLKSKASVEKEKVSENTQEDETEKIAELEAETQQTVDSKQLTEQKTEKVSE